MASNSIDMLHSFKTILQKTEETKHFCTDIISWIDARQIDWENDKIRVGVVGVTSSGKSTVINSILGADILSSAVTPSTGQLVTCFYGTRFQATVVFTNGVRKIFSGNVLTSDNLKKYTDEKYNVKNREKVEKIELTSPYYALDKDVMLVDSPGLDAYGLESHEQLTLESLVPTIDACIYVVTMKANSDRKTKEVLDVINRYNCPIIIVQNKLDSVRPSIDGRKSKAQVAEELLKRVKRIVDGSEIRDKRNVSIIQMSAKDAKDGRIRILNKQQEPLSFKYSNYNGFIELVNNILKVKRPKIEKARKIAILNRMREVIGLIDDKVNSTKTVPRVFPLKDLKERVGDYDEEVDKSYETALKDFSRAAQEVFDLIGVEDNDAVRMNLREISDSNRNQNENKQTDFISACVSQITNIFNSKSRYDEAIEKLNTSVDKFIDKLKKIESEYFGFIEDVSKIIHIPSRDLMKSISLHNHAGKIVVSEKLEERSERKKQEGFGGAVKRGLGSLFSLGGLFYESDLGYEYELKQVLVYDYATMKKNIIDRVATVIQKDTESFKTWYNKQFTIGLQKISQVVEQEEEAFNIRRNLQIQAQDLIQIKKELSPIIKREESLTKDNLARDDIDAINMPTMVIDQRTIKVSPIVEKAIYLSQSILQLQHRRFAKTLIENIGVKSHEAIIVSWDKESVDTFIWQTGIHLKTTQVIMTPVKELISESVKPRCYCVFVDAPQIGSALKQIHSIRLDKIIRNKDCILWVVQDLEELRHGQGGNDSAAVEGLRCVQELSERLGIRNCKCYVWLLHSNPVINYAYMLKQLKNISGISAEQKLLQELRHKFPNNLNVKTLKFIEEIIR